MRIFGALTYGDVELPREEQIAKGIAYFTGLRERQQQIKRAIEELK